MEAWLGNGLELTRWWILRGLGAVYLIAFLSTLNQFKPLLGERGLEPVPAFLKRVRFRDAPSIFHLHYSDRLFTAVAATGVALAVVATLGISDLGPWWLSFGVWGCLWVLYLSIVNVGQTFYSFGWESMTLEAGFYATFFGPAGWAAPAIVVCLFRWMLFRLEVGAGLIKLRGDPCWRDLTCLYYHYESQPLPNPLSWQFHHLPQWFHRISVLFNHFVQVVVPLGLLFPQPLAGFAGALMVVTQLWLMLSGNFSWLNFITLVLAFSAFDDTWLRWTAVLSSLPSTATGPFLYQLTLWALLVLVAVLSIPVVRNLISSRQLMNFSFNPLHLVNTYGAFGSITKERYEIIIEGTEEPVILPTTQWREYEFKGKPGDPRRRPRQVAPYHLRLDWLMWFAAMGPPYHHPWVYSLVVKLLRGDRAVIKLLRGNPFPEQPPKFIRARLCRYRFTTPAERGQNGQWWHRKLVGEYLRPLRLEPLNG